MAVVRWHPTMPWRPFQQPWRPFEGLESLRHEMDRLFEPFAGGTPPSGIRESEWIPRVDLLEHENVFVLVADLPGMHQADINVSVQDNVLTLEGKRTLEHVENGQGTYHYSERQGHAAGAFCSAPPSTRHRLRPPISRACWKCICPRLLKRSPSGSRCRRRPRYPSGARAREVSARAVPG